MKVLVIDDEPLVRRSLGRALTSKKYDVIEAPDGNIGQTLWLEHQPELVIIDVLMPGKSGPQVIEEMQGKHKSKIVLISAFSGEYNMNSAKALGANLFIGKPFGDIFQVIEQIESVL